jgi:hypothetical protein
LHSHLLAFAKVTLRSNRSGTDTLFRRWTIYDAQEGDYRQVPTEYPTPYIARMTLHTKEACDRYIEAFKKASMVGKIKPLEIARVLGMSERLVDEYIALIEEQRTIEGEGNHVS